MDSTCDLSNEISGKWGFSSMKGSLVNLHASATNEPAGSSRNKEGGFKDAERQDEEHLQVLVIPHRKQGENPRAGTSCLYYREVGWKDLQRSSRPPVCSHGVG